MYLYMYSILWLSIYLSIYLSINYIFTIPSYPIPVLQEMNIGRPHFHCVNRDESCCFFLKASHRRYFGNSIYDAGRVIRFTNHRQIRSNTLQLVVLVLTVYMVSISYPMFVPCKEFSYTLYKSFISNS